MESSNCVSSLGKMAKPVFTSQFFYSLEDVYAFCVSEGLLSSVYMCPVCRCPMALRTRNSIIDKVQWTCNTSTHEITRQVRRGSWFQRSHLSLRQLLLMTHLFVLDVSNSVISRELGVGLKTVGEWRNFFREVCALSCSESFEPIGGKDVIVEVDESMFGKKKTSRNKNVEAKWVFGGVERGSKRCFFKVVEKRDKKFLLDVLMTYVLPGTTVYSYCWKSYDCLKDKEFKELAVSHSLSFKDPEKGDHANTIKGIWSAIKRAIPRHISMDALDNYLFEYIWRRKNTPNGDLTRTFFEALKQLYPPMTSDDPAHETQDSD